MEPAEKKDGNPLLPETTPTVTPSDTATAPVLPNESAKKSIDLARQMGIGPFKTRIRPSGP